MAKEMAAGKTEGFGGGVMYSYLSGLSEGSRTAYRSDLHCFAEWLGLLPIQAVDHLLGFGPAAGHELAIAYRTYLLNSGAAGGTIARRMTVLRGLTRIAKLGGQIDWELSVSGEKSDDFLYPAGPGRDGLIKMLEVTEDSRDRAVLHLAIGVGLTRGEVAALDKVDYNPTAGQLFATIAGRAEPLLLFLSEEACAAIDLWLRERGRAAGPLFYNYDPCLGAGNKSDSPRLTGRSVGRIVARAAHRAGYSHRILPSGKPQGKRSGLRRLTTLLFYGEGKRAKGKKSSAKRG